MKCGTDYIVCMPLFNSYGLIDRILTWNGRFSRSFVGISDLATALINCGIDLDLLAGQVPQLMMGLSIEVPASRAQAEAFYDCSGAAGKCHRLNG
jgi:hypothetical protein